MPHKPPRRPVRPVPPFRSRQPRETPDLWFRELLEKLSVHFLRFFLPELAALVDPASLKVLPQRLIGRLGRERSGDLFIHATLAGQPAALVIAIEHKGQPDDDDWRQLLEYTVILWRQQKLPVHPILLLSYAEPLRPHATNGTLQSPTMKVADFFYNVVQINQHDWQSALASGNPAALALAACMRIEAENRVPAKLEFLRQLARQTLPEEEMELVMAFFDHHLRLSEQEQLQFEREMASLQRKGEPTMLILTNSFKEQGRREGKLEGILEGKLKGKLEGILEGKLKGIVEGKLETVLRLLRRRCGTAAEDFSAQVRRLGPARLDELADALLDFQHADDLREWLLLHGE